MSYKLKRLANFQGRQGPILLIILDGVGLGKEYDGNAVYLANPTTLNNLTKECQKKGLYCTLKAHGKAVGMLSDNDMGNSEVGHNALGSGQIYNQGIKLVDSSIKSGQIFQTDLWKKLTDNVKKKNSTAHLLGLLSDGNVHSNFDQIFKLIEGMAKSSVKKLRMHILTDGRDVQAKSALKYVRLLEDHLRKITKKYGNGQLNYQIASGGGRMRVTMDRYESNWKIVQRGWNAHVLGKISEEELVNGYKGYYKTTEEAISHARECFPEVNDQFLPPFVIIDKSNNPIGKIQDDDIVVNFNFRGDRAIQISKAFENPDFDKFDRVFYPKVEYAGLLEYDGDEHIPKQFLVNPTDIKDILSDYCCENNITSYAIAETHKFGHVTYFWNGNRSGYICKKLEKFEEEKSDPNELIPIKPEMKAVEVCKKTSEALESGKFKFVRVNFANGDMVGHTGIIEAAVKAVKVVDNCIEQLIEVVERLNGIAIITADHGNCDEMKFPDGNTITAHSLNPVGFWLVDKNWQNDYQINSEVINPGLSNVAATILNLLGFEKPKHFRESLIKFT